MPYGTLLPREFTNVDFTVRLRERHGIRRIRVMPARRWIRHAADNARNRDRGAVRFRVLNAAYMAVRIDLADKIASGMRR